MPAADMHDATWREAGADKNSGGYETTSSTLVVVVVVVAEGWLGLCLVGVWREQPFVHSAGYVHDRLAPS